MAHVQQIRHRAGVVLLVEGKRCEPLSRVIRTRMFTGHWRALVYESTGGSGSISPPPNSLAGKGAHCSVGSVCVVAL